MAQNDLNIVALVARLTRDPELRSLPSGTAVSELRVAFNTSRKNNATGEYDDVSNYANVSVWGAQAENAVRFLSKGSRIGIQGSLQWREWEAGDGAKRQELSINARSIQFLTPKADGEGSAPASRPAAAPAATGPYGGVAADDDIPF
jgi:single-strand DNA-binding protein